MARPEYPRLREIAAAAETTWGAYVSSAAGGMRNDGPETLTAAATRPPSP
jgi:hypothetical protein